MEKLLAGLIFLLFTCTGFAQTRLYIMQVSGTVTGNNEIPIKKGDAIERSDRIKLMPGAAITCIDDNGNTYTVNKTGIFSYENLLKTKKKYQHALTLEYLKYLWVSFLNQAEGKTMIAGVFRGDHLMLSPADSAWLLFSDVVLRWQSDPGYQEYHVFIREAGRQDEIKRFTTQDTTLHLHHKLLLTPNITYEWTVSTRAYPNLKNIPFFTLRTLDEAAFKAQKKNTMHLGKT